MGQRELLLIALTVIIVGIAVSVGIQMFGESALQANRDAVIADVKNLAGRARQYYLKPSRMAGGNRSFVGLTADAAGLAKLTAQSTNENGTYSIAVAGTASEVVLQGDGVEDVQGTRVRVRIWVRADAATDSVAITYVESTIDIEILQCD